MPQLDASTFSSQLFWLFVSFSTLYLFTWRVTVPRIAKILEMRWQRIEGNVKHADDLNREAEKIKKDYEKELDAVRQTAQENVMQMIHNVSVTSSQRRKDISDMMMSRIQSAEAHIQRQKTQALGDIKTIAESVALAAVERLTNEKADPKVVEDILNDLIDKKVA